MSKMNTIFKKDPNEYKTIFNPIDDNIKQAAIFISKSLGVSIDDAIALVKDEYKNDDNIVNPKVEYRERDLKGDITNHKGTLVGYLNNIRSKKYITVPSMTQYFKPEVKKSLHSEFTLVNVANRNKHKKLATEYKLKKEPIKETYHTVLQKVLKIFNNSLSGAYASGGTILYNPSAHYTLTSITRCVASIGNAISESMIGGVYHYRDPDITLNHLLAMVDSMDSERVDRAITKYFLHIPTTDEIMSHLIYKNTRRYWEDEEKERDIYNFIDSLTDSEKVFISYANNFHLLRVLNDKLIRTFIKTMLDDNDVKIEDPIAIINNSTDWMKNLIVHLEIGSLRGKRFDARSLDEETVLRISKTIRSIEYTLIAYRDLIQTFFITTVFPPSVAYLKEMLRESIVLSDTDSTCATYQDWAHWYKGELVVDPESIKVTAIIMTLVTQTIDHYIQTFGINMNITAEKASYLKMKNEFFWDVFVNSDVAKHYFAQVLIQEGVVFEEPDLEIKGVHLIASTAFKEIRETAKAMMLNILNAASNNEKISILTYIDIVLDIEISIKNSVERGDISIYKLGKIKEKETYKNGPEKSPFIHHLLWNEVFRDKYGEAPEPPYNTIKIPLTINSKKDMDIWLNNIEDRKIADALSAFLKRYNKTEIKTLYLPFINSKGKGIPKEIRSVINTDRIIRDNCNVLYIVLNSLGYYLKPGQKLIDVYESFL